MNQQTKRLASTLGVMALAGAGALIGLAKGAPALAGAMAKISVSMLKLKFAIGDALKPQFEWFSDKLSWFGGWVAENPDLFGTITTSVIALGTAFLAFKAISIVISTFIGVASVLIALVSSPTFLAALATLGVAAALWAFVSGQANVAREQEAFYKSAGISQDEVIQAGIQGYQGTIYPGMTTGAYTGGVSSSDINVAAALDAYYASNVSRKQMTMALQDST